MDSGNFLAGVGATALIATFVTLFSYTGTRTAGFLRHWVEVFIVLWGIAALLGVVILGMQSFSAIPVILGGLFWLAIIVGALVGRSDRRKGR